MPSCAWCSVLVRSCRAYFVVILSMHERDVGLPNYPVHTVGLLSTRDCVHARLANFRGARQSPLPIRYHIIHCRGFTLFWGGRKVRYERLRETLRLFRLRVIHGLFVFEEKNEHVSSKVNITFPPASDKLRTP